MLNVTLCFYQSLELVIIHSECCGSRCHHRRRRRRHRLLRQTTENEHRVKSSNRLVSVHTLVHTLCSGALYFSLYPQ